MLTSEAEAEIAELAKRFGAPVRWKRTYEVPPESAAWVTKMLKRRGEVILVVPSRKDHVWLHTKLFYPATVYRLPSGGIHEGETAEAAAYREAYEEMGFRPELERFLGVVENVFRRGGDGAVYPTFILGTNPIPLNPKVKDPDEAISGFRDVRISELPKIVEQLDGLASEWQPWGHFRAAPHALVVEALRNGK